MSKREIGRRIARKLTESEEARQKRLRKMARRVPGLADDWVDAMQAPFVDGLGKPIPPISLDEIETYLDQVSRLAARAGWVPHGEADRDGTPAG